MIPLATVVADVSRRMIPAGVAISLRVLIAVLPHRKDIEPAHRTGERLTVISSHPHRAVAPIAVIAAVVLRLIPVAAHRYTPVDTGVGSGSRSSASDGGDGIIAPARREADAISSVNT